MPQCSNCSLVSDAGLSDAIMEYCIYFASIHTIPEETIECFERICNCLPLDIRNWPSDIVSTPIRSAYAHTCLSISPFRPSPGLQIHIPMHASTLGLRSMRSEFQRLKSCPSSRILAASSGQCSPTPLLLNSCF